MFMTTDGITLRTSLLNHSNMEEMSIYNEHKYYLFHVPYMSHQPTISSRSQVDLFSYQ